MKICLQEDVLINNGDQNIKIKFNEKMFLHSVMLIADDIKKNYDFKNKKIGLIGIARGALPLLVALSHELEIRRIGVIQIQMTNSDKKYDYGEAKIDNGYIDEECDEYIILEDVVSHGRSINLLVNEMTQKNKKITAIYTLLMNRDMKNLKLDNEYMDIKYVYLTRQEQWTYFFWEKGYRDKGENI